MLKDCSKQVLTEREFGDALTSQTLAGVVLPISGIQKARVGTVSGGSANGCDPWGERCHGGSPRPGVSSSVHTQHPSLESSQTRQRNGLCVRHIANRRCRWAKRQTKHIDSINHTL
jgi:hypothetical protein